MSCDHTKGEVLETRRHEGAIYRRRECHLCGLRYLTSETLFTGPMPNLKPERTPKEKAAPTRKNAPSITSLERDQQRRMASGAAALAAVFK